ncbi:MAG: anhydro-N-acetylmuramic acid kinase, partial [Gemmobacter sp.]
MEPVRVLGMMSGTSLDGVDAALMRTDGEGLAEPGRSAYRPYAPAERAVLRAALGRWPGEAGVAEAARIVEDAHAEVAAGFPEAELLAFHGQTLAHDPGGRGTHQAGSGARLAALTGRAVAWDFRSADVAAGGQGARKRHSRCQSKCTHPPPTTTDCISARTHLAAAAAACLDGHPRY